MAKKANDQHVDEPNSSDEVIYRAHCVGITPLMMHAMSPEVIERVLIGGERPPKENDLSPEQRCDGCFYKNGENLYGIPAENLFAAMKYAGRFLKMGNVKVSTASTTQLPSFLRINEGFLPFPEDEQFWVPDVRRGVMRAGGKEVAVGITRPRFDKWSFDVTFSVALGDGVSEKTIEKLLRYAGRKAGLCSFRPSCGGQFGQFEVESFEKVG